jgi:hypothetical protein
MMAKRQTDPGRRFREWLADTWVCSEHGMFCPQCTERIDDNWPLDCDACGYPRVIEDDDGDDYERD